MAQTTTHVNACDASIWLDDAANTLTDISGSSNSVSLNFVRDIREFRVADSGSYPYRSGQWVDGEIVLRAVYSTATDEAVDLLNSWFHAAGVLSARSMNVAVVGAAGTDYYFGEVVLESLRIPAESQEPGPIPVEARLLTKGAWDVSDIMWYVDSVNGSDANNGRSPSEAFATIAAVEAVLGAGESVGLARGSHWREQLDITDSNVSILAYGEGDRPLLDASNVAANASFAKTGGRVNVYEIDITPEWYGAGKDWVNVWEDDDFLTRASDVANCDATPGSYYPSAEGAGTITLYVHSTDSSSVITNGYVYEYTHRQFGLDTRNASGVSLLNLWTRRNLHSDGSLRIGPSGTATNIYCDDGSAHNVLFETGSTLTNVEAREAYTTGSFIMFIGNSDSPASEGLTLVDCTASLTTYDVDATGFGSHANIGGSFGVIALDGCVATNLGTAFAVNDGSSFTHDECSSTGCRFFLRDSSTNTYTVTGGSWTFTGTAGRALDGQVAGTRVFEDFTIDVDDPGSGIFYSAQVIDLTLTDCSVTNNDSATANANFIYLTNAGASLTVSGTSFFTPNLASGPYIYYCTNGLATLDSDWNCFNDPDQWFNIGGNNYGTVAAYQVGEGQDLHSQIGGCS